MRKNAVYAGLFGASLLLLTVFGESVLPLLLLGAMALIIAVSLLLSRVFAGAVTAAAAVESVSERNRALTGTVTLTNRSRFPFLYLGVAAEMRNLLTGEVTEQTVFRAVPPRGKTVSSFSFSSRYCGKARFTVKALVYADYLGVFRFSRPVGASSEALILPEMFPLDVTVVKSGVTEPECDRFSPYRSGDDPSETFAIRDYEPGDPLRSVHWKLTGKFDRLVIREASLPVDESVLILFERVVLPGGAPAAAAVRGALGEIAVSLSQKLTEMKIAHTVGWLSAGSGAFAGHRVDSEETFQLLLTELLSVSELEGTENTVEGYMKAVHPGNYSNIIYLASVSPENLFLLPPTAKKTVILCADDGAGAAVSGEADLYGVTPENYETALYPLMI
ncbi:MAG: DUF58 domain-containing protein [Bacillota bacterium]|jgi:uncharacterized protein (DUF58 family)